MDFLLQKGRQTIRCLHIVPTVERTVTRSGLQSAALQQRLRLLHRQRFSTSGRLRAQADRKTAANRGANATAKDSILANANANVNAKAKVKGQSGQYKPLQYSPSSRKPPPPPSVNSSTPSPKDKDPLRYRRLPLILGGLTAFCISSYSAYLYVSYRRAVADSEKTALTIPDDTSYRYDALAPKYDALVEMEEWLMGLHRLRQKMASQATGDVCEVSIGTGRNLGFYDWDFEGFKGVGKVGKGYAIQRGKVRSFTGVDKSEEMVEVARKKFNEEVPGIEGGGRVRWVVHDAREKLPEPPLLSPSTAASAKTKNRDDQGIKKKYDTIVQTMGLCSTGDPVALLKNLGESIEPETGRILLLEHGRATWNWVNKILDSLAARHAAEFGCWWNRDIGKIVEESGLEVVKMERRLAGTTWWLELKTRSTAKKVEDVGKGS